MDADTIKTKHTFHLISVHMHEQLNLHQYSVMNLPPSKCETNALSSETAAVEIIDAPFGVREVLAT